MTMAAAIATATVRTSMAATGTATDVPPGMGVNIDTHLEGSNGRPQSTPAFQGGAPRIRFHASAACRNRLYVRACCSTFYDQHKSCEDFPGHAEAWSSPEAGRFPAYWRLSLAPWTAGRGSDSFAYA